MKKALSLMLIGVGVLCRPSAALDKVWDPFLDYWTQIHYEITPDVEDSYHHPLFTTNQSEGKRTTLISMAVQNAYDRGLKIIDIPFITASPAPAPYPGDGDAAFLSAFNVTSLDWLRAVDDFNQFVSNGDYLKVRIRVNCRALEMQNVYYYSFPSQSAAPAGVKTIPLAYNESKNAADGEVMDLANSTVRGYMVDWTKKVLDCVHANVSDRTKVQEVALILEASGESDSFGDGNLTSYSCSRYPGAGAPLAEKLNYFRGKETYLKKMYTDFAAAVHGYQFGGVNKGLKAAIFFQTWAFDGRERGAFDLFNVMNGSGIDKLHHTQFPQFYDQSIEATAFSASVADKLGIRFDTEFSWAHYHDNTDVDITPPGSDILYYNPLYLSVTDQTLNGYIIPGTTNPINVHVSSSNLRADKFHFQAKAGLQNGANGVTFATWTMQEMASAPDSPNWLRIVGPPDPDSAYLAAPLGYKTISQLPYPANKVAIYVSTVGRMNCEEETALGKSDGCSLGDYYRWFINFGLYDGGPSSPILNSRVDILTDQMIKSKGTALLDQYQTIYAPFETSKLVNSSVYRLLKGYARNSIFMHQGVFNGAPSESFAAWMTTAKSVSQCGDGNGSFSSAVDIGGATFGGCSGSDGSNYVMETSGKDVGGSSDKFRYLYGTVTGNRTLIAKVNSVQNTSASAKAGVMFRTSTASNSMSAAAFILPDGTAKFVYRKSAGATSSTLSTSAFLPGYLKLQRTSTSGGTNIKAYVSSNGSTWKQFASVTVNLGSTYLAGLAAAGNSPSNYLGTSTYSGIKSTSP